jgi:hypothetical protein
MATDDITISEEYIFQKYALKTSFGEILFRTQTKNFQVTMNKTKNFQITAQKLGTKVVEDGRS